MSNYNSDNIFAKIIRGEIPCDKVYEDDQVLAFNDIQPQAPVHVLVIPKSPYVGMADFSEKAADAELTSLMRAVGKIAADLGLNDNGYRVITNNGGDAGQEVPHLHFHILGGEPIGPLRAKS